MENEQLAAPTNAFRFDAGASSFKFADPPSADAPADGAKLTEHAVELQVRSAEPIAHWYWGRIVHDMTGMQLRKETCPLDYCHFYDEIVGVANKFNADPTTGLSASGKLISIKDDDRAWDLIQKGMAGIPYEASLDWSGPARIEWVDEGITVQVNGREFAGPGYVVREWELRAIAICPYGADSSTKTSFADGDPTCEVTLFSERPIVLPKPTTPANPLQQHSEAPSPAKALEMATPERQQAVDPTAAARAQFTAELKRFTEAFGDLGAKAFADGKTFEEAALACIADLRQQLKAKEQVETTLKQQLASVPRGESEPVSTSDAAKPTNSPPAKFKGLPDGLARFAASLEPASK